MVAAFVFLITPAGQMFFTLLTKECKFKTLSKIGIAAEVLNSVVTIGLALLQFGVLSLILGQLITSVFTVCIYFLVFRKTWLPKCHFEINDIKSYFSFGAFQMGERTLNYLFANIDYIIVGRLLGPAALGFYTLAYQTMITPLTKVNPIITRVAYPVFSKIQNDDAKMRAGFCKVITYISTMTFPMLAGMLVVAPEFTKLVYGANWEPSIVVLQIFCLVGVVKSLGNPVGSVLLAKGRPDIGFYFNLFSVVIIAITVIIGVHWGITGVAIAILLLQAPLFFIIQPIVNRLIGLEFSQYFKALQSPFFCSLIMLLGIIPLRMVLGSTNMVFVFSITVVAGIFIYALSYYVKDRMFFLEIKLVLKGG
jgi:O-antigen/teichoic acid export membrane protein